MLEMLFFWQAVKRKNLNYTSKLVYIVTQSLNVERCRSRPCLHPDLLLAEGFSSKCMDLAMCVLGGFAKGLVSGAAVYIRPL